MWNKAGECPERVEELGPVVWNPQGVKILGTHTSGFRRFRGKVGDRSIGKLWVGSQICNARGKCFYSRTEMPPLLAHSATLPDRHLRRGSRLWHDAGHGEVVGRVHWEHRSTSPSMSNRFSAFLPLGRLGMRSAARMSQATYCVSWADALHMIQQSFRNWQNNLSRLHLVIDLAKGFWVNCRIAATSLDHQGFVNRPTWTELSFGQGPLATDCTELGEWQHGWQFHASSSSEHFFRETVVLAQPGSLQVAFWTGIK